jgi:hypothetical protein
MGLGGLLLVGFGSSAHEVLNINLGVTPTLLAVMIWMSKINLFFLITPTGEIVLSDTVIRGC